MSLWDIRQRILRAHPPLCRKLINNGNKSPRGCAKGEDCDRLHPKMCPSSINHGECLNDSCSLYHVKDTRRLSSRPHPQEQSSRNKQNAGHKRNEIYQLSPHLTIRTLFRCAVYMETRAAGCFGPKNSRGARETSTTHANAVFALFTPRTRSPDPFGDPSSSSGASTHPILSMFNYLNIRGLVPQTASSGVAFAVTETWLNDTRLDAKLYIYVDTPYFRRTESARSPSLHAAVAELVSTSEMTMPYQQRLSFPSPMESSNHWEYMWCRWT